MDQHEDKKWGRKWHMPWFDWLVFLLPAALFISLGLESAFAPAPPPGSPQHHDFRAVAHWFDPVFFQYNLVMALLVVLVVPSLALSYIQTMANRKERRLYRDVPPERRNEVRRRMGRRASFSNYRGSVWLTTTVVLLGVSILLLFKPVSSAQGMGLNFALGSNMLTMGPFVELFERDPQAYYSHLVRNMIAFQFGFLGAYVYFVGSVVRAYFTLDLTSHTFVDGAIRMIVASILALVLSFAFDFFTFTAGDKSSAVVSASHESKTSAGSSPGSESTPAMESHRESHDSSDKTDAEGPVVPASLSLLPVVAFFFGFYPKRASLAIERIALKTMRNIVPADSYRALPLSMLAGMSYTHELRLEREGFDNLENLSTADAVDLAIRTCFSYTQLQQWIDQAWLAAHLREDYPDFVRRTGISTSEELRCFLCNEGAAQANGRIEQLVAALTADPAAASSWKVRLTALKMLLEASKAPSQKVEVPRPDEPKAS